MEGGKRTRGKEKLAATEISSLKSMTGTTARVAYDLIGHKEYLIDNALCREVKLCK
jgi:hypothetical protein